MSDPLQGFNLITSLQADVAARAREGVASFTGREGLDIVTEDMGDVLAALAQRLSMIGIGVAVVTPKIAKGERTGEILVTITLAINEKPTVHPSSHGPPKTPH